MNLKLLTRKIYDAVRRDGVPQALHRGLGLIRRDCGADDFDRQHGTETAGVEPLWKFDIRSPNARFGVRYQTAGPGELEAAIASLNENPPELAFVDLGCGKGRALVIAHKLGFKRIVGVEFVPQLAAIARTNLEKIAADGSVIEGDAADYRLPNEDMVLYLNNPFARPVMERVMANLRRSTAPRLYVIYRRPECAELFETAAFLRELAAPPECHDLRVWSRRTE